MGAFDPETIYTAQLAGMLASGERVLAAATASYFSGHEELGQPGYLSFDLVNGLSSSTLEGAAVRAVSGLTLVGFPGSLATVARDALRDANTLVVTDRRVRFAQLETHGNLIAVIGRHQVAGAVLEPRIFQSGRVTVAFTDGSMLRVMCGMFSARAARRLVAALPPR